MVAEKVAVFLKSLNLETLIDCFEEFDEETFFGLTTDLIIMLVKNSFHAAKLAVKLNAHRAGNKLVQPAVQSVTGIPTSKQEIENIRDVDLQCVIQVKRDQPNYKLTTRDEHAIVEAIIKFILARHVKVTGAEFQKCAEAIAELFSPGTEASVFYADPNKGKLYMKLARYRHQMNLAGLIVLRGYKKKGDRPVMDADDYDTQTTEPEAQNSQIALQNTIPLVDPQEVVLKSRAKLGGTCKLAPYCNQGIRSSLRPRVRKQ